MLSKPRLLLALCTLLVLTVSPLPAAPAAPVPEGPIAADEIPALVAHAEAEHSLYLAGQPVTIHGTVSRVIDAADAELGSLDLEPVEAELSLVLSRSDGTRWEVPGRVRTGADGRFQATLPAELTADIEPLASTGHRETLAVEMVDVEAGALTSEHAGVTGVVVAAEAGVQVENSFQSFTGWVKPAETYPFRIHVRNYDTMDATDVEVTVAAPPGATFVGATDLGAEDTTDVADDGSSITWTVGTLPAADEAGPAVRTLVAEGLVANFEDDPRIVWKDLSSTATLTYTGGPAEGLTSTSHGPKVIPPDASFETARYGDKKFPMVPVEYTDRGRQSQNTAEALTTAVNDPEFEGSTFNLYQEMSYGQLFPEGTVPSAGIATATFSEYEHGFDFTTPDTTRGTCRGTNLGPLVGTPLFDERIVDGWYQLPGDTEYYGGDYPAFTLGIGSSIDSACGQLGKGVYDAAVIADPEIDYNDYDSDKDGVVDFFMLVFVGCGGNGASQLATAPDTPFTNELCPYGSVPYDNIWPHSSNLEGQYRDPATGLRGYISDDQLIDLEGRAQCWVDDRYLQSDTCAADGGLGDDSLPNLIRVGPYNVNPETAIEAASVISHEYGHYLGLPDYYSSYSAYGTYNLMAADYSQHMTIFSKQELGWVVPQYVQPGETTEVQDWAEIKENTGEIHWQTPDGEPYVLSEANGDQNVNNGLAFSAKLPPRLVIDPEKVAEQASPPTVFWSGRGNQFGCPPTGGHNLDIWLPELMDVPAGTEVTLSFKSSWDIEWDWDYGFTMVTTDGADYTSLPSEEGYTTENSYNPNNQACFAEHDNGLTGLSGSYEQGPAQVALDRNPVDNNYDQPTPFLVDSYDLSDYAGEENVTLRFSYFTDEAFDRPGWFIDDIEVKAGDEVIYSSDFEQGDERGRIFPGGCDPDGFDVAVSCTVGWTQIKSDAGNPVDHAYYIELRDRAGFDFDGHGQSDRGAINWEPGILLEYTDESHGFGNNGVPLPPSQHYLNSTPEPGAQCPTSTCTDWSFTADEGRSHFDDIDNVQNFSDPSREPREVDGTTVRPWLFDFGCLTMDVTSMSGGGADSAALPSDLTASVTLSGGEGCVEYVYPSPAQGGDGGGGGGGQEPLNAPPVARAQARPAEVQVGEPVTFDGSRSSDDRQSPEALEYEWDFDGDGTTDATTQTARHAYDEAGEYTARLTVTDSGGLGDTATVRILVTEPAPGTVTRIFGAGRVETAIELSRSSYGDGEAETVVLARADIFPDALASSALAAEVDGPILLTASDRLLPQVAEEIRRLGATTVYLAGGTAALSAEVEEAIRDDGRTPQRLAGAERFDTANLVAREVVRLGGSVPAAVLARADDFPDALAAANISVAARVPILLTPTDDVPQVTLDALRDVVGPDGVVYIAGGAAAVSSGAEEQVREAGHRTERRSGRNRYETAVALVEEARALGAGVNPTYFASGRNFPDALVAAPIAGRAGGVLQLIDPETIEQSPAIRDWIDANVPAIRSAVIVGGTAAVSDGVMEQVRQRLGAQ